MVQGQVNHFPWARTYDFWDCSVISFVAQDFYIYIYIYICRSNIKAIQSVLHYRCVTGKIYVYTLVLHHCWGCAMTKVPAPHPAESQVCSRARPYGVCGGHEALGQVSVWILGFSPLNVVPTMLHTHFLWCAGCSAQGVPNFRMLLYEAFWVKSGVSVYLGISCWVKSGVSVYHGISCWVKSGVSIYLGISCWVKSGVSIYLGISCWVKSGVSVYLGVSCWVKSGVSIYLGISCYTALAF